MVDPRTRDAFFNQMGGKNQPRIRERVVRRSGDLRLVDRSDVVENRAIDKQEHANDGAVLEQWDGIRR
jgi:hypothetical protein